MNLYEILEVNEKASKEIIEKVYKIKVKKYHPDLQKQEDKLFAEEKMKELNEAYDILSDDYKRRQYDEMLEEERKQSQNNENQNFNEYKNDSMYGKNVYYNQYDNREYTNDSEEYYNNNVNKSVTRLKIVVVILIIAVSVDFLSSKIYKNKEKDEEIIDDIRNELTDEEYKEIMDGIFEKYK